MNVREHAFTARALQDACGGPAACLELLDPTPFRMRQTHLYDTRDPATGRTMPVGAVAFLERRQGWRFYSLKLFRQSDTPTAEKADAVSEACEAFEAMALVQRLVRRATRRGFTENACREIEQALQLVEGGFARLRSAMDDQVAQAVAA